MVAAQRAYKSVQDPQAKNSFSEAFVAAPMSAFDTDAGYKAGRDDILRIVKHLKHCHSLSKVYYAGENINSQSDFDGETLALKTDIEALRRSDLFILYYPWKVASSVLVEAGYAFSMEIPMLLLVKDESDLPYLFRQMNSIPPEKGWIPSLRICKFSSGDDLLQKVDEGLSSLAKCTLRKPHSS